LLRHGSVGSATFWLSGSGYAKICGTPDPRAKYQSKTANKYHQLPKLKSELLNKEIVKNFLISEWFTEF